MPHRPGPPLLLALACLLGFVVTGVLALLAPSFGARDGEMLQGFMELQRPHTAPLVDDVAHLADPAVYGAGGIVLVLVALVQGRRRLALAIPVVLVAAGATTTLLKPLLATPRPDAWLGAAAIGDASWPSGHASAAMTLGLLAVLALPPRARPTAAAVGGVYAISVGYAILVLGWHWPSDVVGGYLNAAIWVLLAAGLLAALERRWPERAPAWAARLAERPVRPVDRLAPLAVGTGAAAAVAVVVLARRDDVADRLLARPTWTAGAIGIAALATLLAGALARLLARASSREGGPPPGLQR